MTDSNERKLGVAVEESKTFLVEVSESEARMFPQYDGVNDPVDLDDAQD